MRSSSTTTFMCRPATTALRTRPAHRRHQRPKESGNPTTCGEAATTEPLQVRPWLQPNSVRPIRVVHAVRIQIVLLGASAPPPLQVPDALFHSCCKSRTAPAAMSWQHDPKCLFESCCMSRTAPAAMSPNLKARTLIRNSATRMCRPEALSTRHHQRPGDSGNPTNLWQSNHHRSFARQILR